MPYTSNRVLHTDQNPNDPNFSGGIFEETDPNGAFVLAGKNKIISDQDAERWGLVGRDGISKTTLEEVRAAHDAKNRATYGDNASGDTDGVTVEPPRENPVAATSEATEDATETVETPEPPHDDKAHKSHRRHK